MQKNINVKITKGISGMKMKAPETSEELHRKAVEIFNEGWDNFLSKTAIGKSNYSNREIMWMNDVSIAMEKAQASIK